MYQLSLYIICIVFIYNCEKQTVARHRGCTSICANCEIFFFFLFYTSSCTRLFVIGPYEHRVHVIRLFLILRGVTPLMCVHVCHLFRRGERLARPAAGLLPLKIGARDTVLLSGLSQKVVVAIDFANYLLRSSRSVNPTSQGERISLPPDAVFPGLNITEISLDWVPPPPHIDYRAKCISYRFFTYV